ncbi:hypothetical protein KP509_34G043000 [Ceratopteris richardii]|nr:hypothetical protein KP509_34G043000 [Ceratopteris richardii]
MHPSSQSMRPGADMLRLEKHGRSEVASSPNMMSLRRENARVHSISPLSNLGFRNHNQKRSISKQTYPNSSSISRSFKTNIGFSPLSNEGFTRDKKPSQASTDALNKYVHTNRDYDGISSPWAPSISTQKFRRSKSISAASEISNVGRHSSFSSPESKISKQKSVTFSKHVYYGSPLWNDMQRSSYRSPSKEKRVQRYIGSPHVNVLKRMPHRSRLDDHEQDVLGHLEGNQSILPNRLNHSAVLSSSHPVSHDPIAHVNSDRIQSPRPANMLLPRSKDDSVSVECGKVRRVSPLFLSTHSKSSSPGSRSQQGLGQSSLPLCMHNLHGSRAETGTYVLPNASRFEDGSDLLVSDEHCNFNGMAQQRINSRTLTIMREDKAEAYHHSGDLKKEPASSSYEFPNSTKGWSKALGGMLGIRRKKKDSIKDQPLSYMTNDYTHHHIHSMALHSDQHQDHADDDDDDNDDDSDFIDYDPKDLYHDDFCRHQHYLPHLPCRQPLKIHRVQSRKPQISRITETGRSSQKYSFLNKDYGAFSH